MTSVFLILPKQIPKEVVFAAPPVTMCFHKPPPSTPGPEDTAHSPRLRASAAASQPQNGPRPRLPLNISLLLLPFSELLYKMLWVCPSNRAQVTRGEGLPPCHLYVPRPVRKGKERKRGMEMVTKVWCRHVSMTTNDSLPPSCWRLGPWLTYSLMCCNTSSHVAGKQAFDTCRGEEEQVGRRWTLSFLLDHFTCDAPDDAVFSGAVASSAGAQRTGWLSASIRALGKEANTLSLRSPVDFSNSIPWVGIVVAGGDQGTQRPRKNFMVFQTWHKPTWRKRRNNTWQYREGCQKLLLRRSNGKTFGNWTGPDAGGQDA